MLPAIGRNHSFYCLHSHWNWNRISELSSIISKSVAVALHIHVASRRRRWFYSWDHIYSSHLFDSLHLPILFYREFICRTMRVHVSSDRIRVSFCRRSPETRAVIIRAVPSMQKVKRSATNCLCVSNVSALSLLYTLPTFLFVCWKSLHFLP